MMPMAFIAVGSNLGDRAAWHAFALEGLSASGDVRVVDATTPHETQPLGGADQPPYLNRMLRVETELPPRALLAACHDVESRAGRDRAIRWAPRTLDLDLVRYGDMLCDTPTLVLPHPGLRDRPFWTSDIALLEAR